MALSRYSRIVLTLGVCTCVLGLVGCPSKEPTPPGPTPQGGATVVLSGTLPAALVSRFYHHPEGSEVLPLFLLKSRLLQSGNAQFMENLDRFGLLTDVASPTDNPEALPVGMTAAVPRDLRPLGVKMTGFNCAACHVAELSAEGRTLRIVGAPSRFDIKGFYREFGEALNPLTSSPSTAWEVFQEYVAARRASGTPPPDAGPAAPPSASAQADEAARVPLEAIEIEKPANAFERRFAEAIEKQYQESFREAMAEPSPSGPMPSRARRIGNRLRSEVTGVMGQRATAPPGVFGELPQVRQAAALTQTLFEFDTIVRLLVSRLRLARQIGGVADPVDAGPGRVDAFVTAKNIVFQKTEPTNSPVSFPHIWGIDRLKRLHWDGNTNSVMERNMGQAIGLGAVFDADGQSTLLPREIHELEIWARQLAPPKWPFALDTTQAAKGRVTFDAQCAKCHGPAAASGEACTPLADVGTDPKRAENFDSMVDGDPLWKRLDAFLKQLKARSYQDADPKVLPEEALRMEAGRLPTKWQAPRCYANRTLEGIWATAPFLHNGSVPTLAHLLQLEPRPARFSLGHSAFDTTRVGVAAPAGSSAGFAFDTSVVGNSNQGHVYGTRLSDAEKRDLLEYLKTL